MAAHSENQDSPDDAASSTLPGADATRADLLDCFQKLQQLQLRCDQLQLALSNERDISLAIGITMVQHRLSRAEAFGQLRNVARSRRCKLADLADEIVTAAQLRAQSKS